jgi:hypothetical protein
MAVKCGQKFRFVVFRPRQLLNLFTKNLNSSNENFLLQVFTTSPFCQAEFLSCVDRYRGGQARDFFQKGDNFCFHHILFIPLIVNCFAWDTFLSLHFS